MGRGRSDETKKLIDAMVEIAESIQPCNVRALAYQLFNRKLIPSMALEHTRKVGRLAVIAREEGWIPWEWIVDATRPEQGGGGWDGPEDYAESVVDSYFRKKWSGQPRHVSVWSEKETVAGTLRPVLRELEVTYQILHGWSGATPVRKAAQKAMAREQDTLILYVGDYDPSGMYMSEEDLPRRLARYSYDVPPEEISLKQAKAVLKEVRLEIRRIALTKAHTSKLGIAPRFPASDKKDTDDKKGDSRYEWFVANHGTWCWELDAMSPVDLRDCVRQAIVAELNQEAWDRYVEVQERERDMMRKSSSRWRSKLDHDQK
jgi:hypothetical protein